MGVEGAGFSDDELRAIGGLVVAYGAAQALLWSLAEEVDVDIELLEQRSTKRVRRAVSRKLNRDGLADEAARDALTDLTRAAAIRRKVVRGAYVLAAQPGAVSDARIRRKGSEEFRLQLAEIEEATRWAEAAAAGLSKTLKSASTRKAARRTG